MSRAFKKMFGFGAWIKGQNLAFVIEEKGVDAYNNARSKSPSWRPDFSGATLKGMDFTTANVKAANMVTANLNGIIIDNHEFSDERARPRLGKRGAIVE